MSKTAHHHVEELSAWPLITSIFILLTAFSFLFGFAWNFGNFGRALGIFSVVGIVACIFGWVMEVFGKTLDLLSTKVAMVIFIISEIALFGGLFSSFIYAWVSLGQMPPVGTPEGIPPLTLAFFLSIILFSSSYTMQQAEHALDNEDQKKFLGWLILTIGLGVLLTLANFFRCSSELISDDLPTLERPTNAISGKRSAGNCSGDTELLINSALSSFILFAGHDNAGCAPPSAMHGNRVSHPVRS
jgi:hypothetical protein